MHNKEASTHYTLLYPQSVKESLTWNNDISAVFRNENFRVMKGIIKYIVSLVSFYRDVEKPFFLFFRKILRW